MTNRYFRDRQEAPRCSGLSPLSKADQIQIPIYVYHGDRDQIVPIQQSQWFVSKAKSAGQATSPTGSSRTTRTARRGRARPWPSSCAASTII